MTYFVSAFVLWNVAVFAIYGIDKFKATHKKRRISEATLIAIAFFMGGVGALLGMVVFRHKTRHLKFKVSVPIAVIANAAIVAALVWAVSQHYTL